MLYFAEKDNDNQGPAARPRAREGPPGARAARRRNVNRRGRMQMADDDSGEPGIFVLNIKLIENFQTVQNL